MEQTPISQCCKARARKNEKREGHRCTKCKKDCTLEEQKAQKKPAQKKQKTEKSKRGAHAQYDIKGDRKKEREKEKKIGAPTKFTAKIADEVCQRLAEGESLLDICKDAHIPSRPTIYAWLFKGKEENAPAKYKRFLNRYKFAREIQSEHLFDETLKIPEETYESIVGDDKSDGARVQAGKLRVSARQFYISKTMPQKYGEKLDVTSKDEKLPASNTIAFVDFSKQKDEDDDDAESEQ